MRFADAPIPTRSDPSTKRKSSPKNRASAHRKCRRDLAVLTEADAESHIRRSQPQRCIGYLGFDGSPPPHPRDGEPGNPTPRSRTESNAGAFSQEFWFIENSCLRVMFTNKRLYWFPRMNCPTQRSHNVAGLTGAPSPAGKNDRSFLR